MHPKPVIAVTSYQVPILFYEKDLAALARAKEILERYTPFPGLKILAKACGINELKLKVGFRHVYGVPPRVYYINCKMRLAVRVRTLNIKGFGLYLCADQTHKIHIGEGVKGEEFFDPWIIQDTNQFD